MFPQINHLDDLLPFIEGNAQIRVKDCEVTGFKIVSYMVQDEDTFAGEHEHAERECRGITFYPDGRLAARTLHKFFNIGQRDDVQPHNLRWQNVTRIMVKRDGSMVTPVKLDDQGNWMMKTKKTFTSKEAQEATKLAAETENGVAWIQDVLLAGLTPTFEFTSPKYPIVLVYEKPELTLLHIRNNASGRYLSEEEIRSLNCPFPIVENVMGHFLGDGIPQNLVSWSKLEEYAKTATGVEGVVIQFGQEMVKLKTIWYCELHRSVTFTRWRDIARSVVADQSDDLKAAFALTGRDIAPIVKVEQEIRDAIIEPKAFVEAIVREAQLDNCTAKDLALRMQGHELFGQIMSSFRGKEIDWMQWYERNYLDNEWSLEVVGDEE